jgi:glycosyltransferase involved in cell wall biosynthesis
MVTPHPSPDSPLLSVIVPARNEEATLAQCLDSLLSQTGLVFEVIVVDDASADRTRQIAQSFPRVHVIDAPPLPSGWTGKNNALAAGAKTARGQWLLFTDADTVHRPGSLARSLAEAEHHGAALLSYSPEQEVHGFWENAVMPVIFAELARTYRPSQVCDPASRAAAANGQYLLITRQAYEAVGGHSAVATSLLEDVALAKAVKQSGRRIFFRFGGDAVRTRMYRSFSQLREGWTKNLVLLFPSPLRLAILRLTEFFLIVGSATIAVAAISRGNYRPGSLAAILAVIVFTAFFRRIRKAHFSSVANALALFGLPILSNLLLRSRRAYKKRTVTWKGRTYGSPHETNSPKKSGTAADLHKPGTPDHSQPTSETTVEEPAFRPAFEAKDSGALAPEV